MEVSVMLGQAAFLPCKVRNLGDKLVSVLFIYLIVKSVKNIWVSFRPRNVVPRIARSFQLTQIASSIRAFSFPIVHDLFSL